MKWDCRAPRWRSCWHRVRRWQMQPLELIRTWYLDCYTVLAWWLWHYHCADRIWLAPFCDWLVYIDIGGNLICIGFWVSSNALLVWLPFIKGHWQSPCTALTAGKCLPWGLCKETETVYLIAGDHLVLVTAVRGPIWHRNPIWNVIREAARSGINVTIIDGYHDWYQSWPEETHKLQFNWKQRVVNCIVTGGNNNHGVTRENEVKHHGNCRFSVSENESDNRISTFIFGMDTSNYHIPITEKVKTLS